MTHKPLQIAPKYRARVTHLVKRRCGYFDNKHCLLLDDAWFPSDCPQLSGRVLVCHFFRDIVLPTDPELYGRLLKLEPKRYCVLCKKPLYAVGNAAKYCPSCARKERRRRQAERQRNRRSGIRKLDL